MLFLFLLTGVLANVASDVLGLATVSAGASDSTKRRLAGERR